MLQALHNFRSAVQARVLNSLTKPQFVVPQKINDTTGNTGMEYAWVFVTVSGG